jgi:hypothetical protein
MRAFIHFYAFLRSRVPKSLANPRNLLICAIVLSAMASGQSKVAPDQTIRFAQLTDAHIFDDGWKETPAGAMRIAADDREALAWAISEINHLTASGEPLDFVVFTGDLGLQNVEMPKECNATAVHFEPGQPPVRFDSAVQELANELNGLTVRVLYFVPGNNDLIDEQITDASRFTCFVSALQKKLKAEPSPITLAALDPNGAFSLKGINFTGLDTSSFKKASNYDPACSSVPTGRKGTPAPIKSCPQLQMDALRRYVAPNASAPLVIFTHVPDLNDPYSKHPTWDLPTNLRKQWEDEACRPNVIGIFAGHFHDSNSAYYGSPVGSELLATSKCVAAKTWVTPPLAVKNQVDKNPQARGFLLATITPVQPVQTRVLWFAPGDHISPPARPTEQSDKSMLWVAALVLVVFALLLAIVNKLSRDLRGLVVVVVFLPLSAAILWLAKNQFGIAEGATQVALLVMILLLYGIGSGRITEFTGPGGWGAKFREVASSSIDVSSGNLDLTSAEMQNIPKTGLAEIEHKLRSIAPGKAIVMSLTLGRAGYYDAFVLHSALQALARLPNFRFVLFLEPSGALVSYMSAQGLLVLLDAGQIGVQQIAGSGQDLVDAVNAGDRDRVKNYTGMLVKTITAQTSNEQALEAMGSIGLDAIVVTQDGKPVGVAERGRIVSRMLSALTKGAKG